MKPPEEEQQQVSWWKSNTGRWVVRIVAIGLGAFVLGYLFTAVFFFRAGGRGEVVTVPDLRGRTEAEVRRVMERVDLELELGNSLVNPEVPAGVVLAQTPLPGQEVAPGSLVRVTLSAGRYRRPVPDVLAMGSTQAQAVLQRAGFEVQVEERTDPQPAGRILTMRPDAGTPLELPGPVFLVVSSGPPRIEVPGVLGLHDDRAREALGVAGFAIGEVEYDPFASEAAGMVIGQRPTPGDSARVGSAVHLRVAGGSPWEM